MPIDFLICGTQKGGTSALDAYCRGHPEILMPVQKELHFFDNDTLFGDGEPDYAAYHRLFPDAVDGKIRGESTPVYMYWPDAPQRIHRYNPRARLIVILRNPVDRAYSHWQMEYDQGHETLPFGAAIRAETERLAQADADHRRVYSYVDRGRYLQQLEKLWSLFGTGNVLVLQTERLRTEPGEVLDAVSRFLEIAPFPPVAARMVNQQEYAEPMAKADREYLKSVFSDEIAGLEKALGWQLDIWR